MSYTKDYLKSKAKINEAFFNPNLATADKIMQVAGLSSLAAPLAVGGYYMVSGAVKNLYNNFKYRKKNCDLVDPAKKDLCLSIQRKQMVSVLIREKSKCRKAKNPQECIKSIDNHINKIRQQDLEARQESAGY